MSVTQGQITGGGRAGKALVLDEDCVGRVELVMNLEGAETETTPKEIFTKGEKGKGRKGKIHELQRLKRGHNYMVKASGNCCWKFYQGKYYNGRDQEITASATFKKLNFLPRSVKTHDCYSNNRVYRHEDFYAQTY